MLKGHFGNLDKRGRVVLELLTTERVYCECLTSTINSFFMPLRAGLCPSFDKKYLPAIFINIDKILVANTKFLHELEYLVVCSRQPPPRSAPSERDVCVWMFVVVMSSSRPSSAGRCRWTARCGTCCRRCSCTRST